jgi:hypothetical protein
MSVHFKVVTLKPQRVTNIGLVEAGTDVTEQLGGFQHLASLVDMGDVALVPVGEAFVPSPVSITPFKSVTEEAEAPVADSEEPVTDGADSSVGETTAGDAPSDDGEVASVEYMEDPSGFTIDEVLAYAEAHPDHASMLLELETEGKGRKRIIKVLSALAE